MDQDPASLHRLSVQHAGEPQYQDVRDVTEIVLTERKPIPKQQGAKPQSHQP
jgi:hypothetical protein